MTKDSKCRFIEEYANFKKHCLQTDPYSFYTQRMVKDFCDGIDKIVRNVRKGYITVDECMRCISEIERTW